MSDITERLRSKWLPTGHGVPERCYATQREAADEIDRLRAELAEAKAQRVLDVDGICNAYESGVGHRGRRTASINPYPAGTNEHVAYSIGAAGKPVASEAQRVPDGYVPAPVRPTRAMLEDGADEVATYYDDGNLVLHEKVSSGVYEAMLAAAKEGK